jgi:DNA (cytosine-5)-methyltransferase 3A
MDIVAVSLFDGMSGGHLALSRVEQLNVLRYYSSEIDKYAIKVADHNFPQDTPYRLGSVIEVDGSALRAQIQQEFPDAKILLLGGSPCLNFSMIGARKGSSTAEGVDVVTLEQYLQLKEEGVEFQGQSYLFWEYIRIKKELQPDYFLLENVLVNSHWLPMFNEATGSTPTYLNSSSFAAQNRPRYYWHNLGTIELPVLDSPTIADIVEMPRTLLTIDDGLLFQNVRPQIRQNIKEQFQDITEGPSGFHTLKCTSGFADNKVGITKTPTLRAMNRATFMLLPLTISRDGVTKYLHTPQISATEVAVSYETEQSPTFTRPVFKRVSVIEAERLQTVPSGYTDVPSVSETQRAKMLGNGWTIDVISYLLRHITTGG